MAQKDQVELLVNGKVVYTRTTHPDDDPMSTIEVRFNGKTILQTPRPEEESSEDRRNEHSA